MIELLLHHDVETHRPGTTDRHPPLAVITGPIAGEVGSSVQAPAIFKSAPDFSEHGSGGVYID